MTTGAMRASRDEATPDSTAADRLEEVHADVDPQAVRAMPTQVSAGDLREWLTRDDRPRLVDVRSAAEFRGAHIPGAYNVPLPLIKEHRDEFVAPLDEQIVLICRSDQRATEASTCLADAGLSRLHVLVGGMQAWQRDGGPVKEDDSGWEMERQVRLVAGSLALAGVLASTVAPKAKWLSGAIGAGLVTAAVTDSCAMSKVLAKLPYNQKREPDTGEVLASLAR